MRVSNNMIYAFQGARGWVGFLGFLGFILGFLMFAGCGVAIYVASTKADVLSTSQATLFILAGALAFNGVLAVIPSGRLMALSASCGQFAITRSPNALFQGLIAHRKFWQFWGICTLLSIVLNGMVVIILFSVGAFAAAG
ncbi:MAG: hypothetical protein AAF585_15625 [Verrucomicrobiota bacterium]